MNEESNEPEEQKETGKNRDVPEHLKGCKGTAVWLLLIGIILAILLFQYKMGL